jgi:hypothetical protein
LCADFNFKYEKENIDLRRARVLELVAQGLSQKEIAEKVASSPSTVSLDMQYLRETGKSKMKTHIEERMPMQYEECQAGLKFMLRKAYEIVEDKSKKTQEVLAAMNLAVNIYGRLMDLSTNGVTFEQAVKWIEDRKKILLTPEEEKRMEEVLASEDENEDNDKETEAEEDPKEEE